MFEIKQGLIFVSFLKARKRLHFKLWNQHTLNMQHLYSILPFIETMEWLETEKLPVIHTKSFELQHFVSRVQRPRSKMLLCTGSLKIKKACLKRMAYI